MFDYRAKDKNKAKTGWDKRHNEALNSPRGFETGIVEMLRGLEHYIEAHQLRYEMSVTDDGVLGDGIADIVKGIRTLLNGELGRLDAGTIDARLCVLLNACGIQV